MKNQKGFWFQNLKMTTILNMAHLEETIQRIAYSVSALMKLNSILVMIKTGNANQQLMHYSTIRGLSTTAVVSVGFGRRAGYGTAPQSLMRTAISSRMASMSLKGAMLFGLLYG